MLDEVHSANEAPEADFETWVNDDDIPHLVSEKDGKFRSSALDTDATFSQTFKDAGTIEYFCLLHPHMIVVEP